MAGLGLVSYGSGSSSEDEDDQEMSGTTTAENSTTQKTVVVNGTPSTNVSTVRSSVISSKFIDDEEDDFVGGVNSIVDDDEGEEGLSTQSEIDANPVWSKFLPQPKKVAVVEEDDVEIGPIPPKKTYGDEELPQPPKPSSIPSLSATKFKGKVRISVPFLNSFDEKEPDENAEKRKFMEPSKKGSGLFALLPQPKNSMGFASDDDTKNVFLKNKSSTTSSSSVAQNVPGTSKSSAPAAPSSMNRLIPDSVKNRLKRPAPSTLDQIKAKLNKTGVSATVIKHKDSDSEDDESGDFFSLDATETVDEEALEKLKLPMYDFNKKPEEVPSTSAETMDVDDAQSYEAGSSQPEEDLMRYIQPKRGKKDDVQIIDINADDLRPDNTEWLKNITDESQVPARRSKGLGGMVKRKHQITYLAFEAKAREQELKNQWAQNRANRMATKNKYGF